MFSLENRKMFSGFSSTHRGPPLVCDVVVVECDVETASSQVAIVIVLRVSRRGEIVTLALHFDCYKTPPPKNKFDDFFVISGGMVCQYQRANPPHHLTTSTNPPDQASTSMMMIVECANLLNHSYFPAVCS